MNSCRFSPGHYLDCLESARNSGYHLAPVKDADKFKPSERVLILRHDVDLSLEYALDMALLEKDSGVHSTYYILLHSNLYNATSPDGIDKIRTIRKAGHEIGLNVDTRYYMGIIEFEMLADIAECNIVTWCQHLVTVTPPLIMKYDARDLDKQNFKYISDSAMNWREGCLCKNLDKYERIQALIHPEWRMVSPQHKLNKWQILERLEAESKGKTTNFFRDFWNLMQDYEQSTLIYSKSQKHTTVS